MRTDKTVLCSEYDGLGLSVLSVEPEGVCKGVVQISMEWQNIRNGICLLWNIWQSMDMLR